MATCWNTVVISMAAGLGSLMAGSIVIPNGSFESPVSIFVEINIDGWQKGAKPASYDESGGFAWNQLTGIFKNTAPTSSDHLDNCDGNQAIWMFAIPEVELFQDYDSVDWNDPAPAHAFDARFEVGNSYALTVAINGGGGGMVTGATMRLALFYRDASSNKVMVGTSVVTHSPATFPNHTHLIDFEVRIPAVRAGDPWAGQHIGVQLLSTVTTNEQGGYWDIDNIRLSATREPIMTAQWTNNQFQFVLGSDPGTFEVLATTNVFLPISDWISLGTLTNSSGTAVFTDTMMPLTRRFYRARLLP